MDSNQPYDPGTPPVETLPPMAPPEAPKKSNRTTWIIVIVVLVILCCCCVIASGVGYSQFGNIMNQLQLQPY